MNKSKKKKNENSLEEAVEIVFQSCVYTMEGDNELDHANFLRGVDKKVKLDYQKWLLVKEDYLCKLMIKRLLKEKQFGVREFFQESFNNSYEGRVSILNSKNGVAATELFTEDYLKNLGKELYQNSHYFNAIIFKMDFSSSIVIAEEDNMKEYLKELGVTTYATYASCCDNKWIEERIIIIRDGEFVFQNIALDFIGKIEFEYTEKMLKLKDYVINSSVGKSKYFAEMFNFKINKEEMYYPFVQPLNHATIQKVYLNHYAHNITEKEIRLLKGNSVANLIEQMIVAITMNKKRLSESVSELSDEERKYTLEQNNKLLMNFISMMQIINNNDDKVVIRDKLPSLFDALTSEDGSVYCGEKFLEHFASLVKIFVGEDIIYYEKLNNFIKKTKELEEIEEKEWFSYSIPIQNITNRLEGIKFVKFHMAEILERNINNYCNNLKFNGLDKSFLIFSDIKLDKKKVEDFMVKICNNLYDADKMKPLDIREYLLPEINELMLSALLDKVDKKGSNVIRKKI